MNTDIIEITAYFYKKSWNFNVYPMYIRMAKFQRFLYIILNTVYLYILRDFRLRIENLVLFITTYFFVKNEFLWYNKIDINLIGVPLPNIKGGAL